MRTKTLILTLVLLLVTSSMSYAAESHEGHEIGEIVNTKAKIDKEEKVKEEKTNKKDHTGDVSTNGYISYETYDIQPITPEYTQYRQFVRYLTGSWAPASSYDWNKSQSASLSIGGSLGTGETSAVKAEFNLVGSYTTTYSVTITIAADSSRFSKLAYGSDFNTRTFKIQTTLHHGSGPGCENHDHYVYPWKTANYTEPTDDTYLYVVYQ